ncbi:nucleotidyltransferase family protein [Myxococcus sp. K15C18031901]|uniref:nucleotidyltransferase domain-containing protein n=1 Tax=Myxococcus dinghuensis TaxID=2906761 RepID=UPI0020A6F7D6|nr:nucleotidyltransferase family protein [Myxococcus dinghuensis]MCP3104744.1 nucleotidyltransferase family protein [Myxococcus dinghuensis]
MTGPTALVALLRDWPSAPLLPPPAGEDSLEFVRAAVRHGLAGFVAHAVGQGGWSLPSEASALLRRESLSGAARSIQVKALLLRSLEVLNAEGIVPVALKGYGLGLRLYPDPLQRATRDVDLLVRRDQVDAAARALKRLGLTTRIPDTARHVEASAHHLELQGPVGLVELHFHALSPWGHPLEGDTLLARAVEGTLEGRRVRWLRPEDEAVYLSLHAGNHLLQRLAWLFDLKLLARKGVDWPRVVEAARETGQAPAAWYGWETARRLLGAPVPEEVLTALAPPSWQRLVAARLFTASRLAGMELLNDKPAWVAAKLLLAPSARTVAAYSLRRLRSRLRAVVR